MASGSWPAPKRARPVRKWSCADEGSRLRADWKMSMAQPNLLRLAYQLPRRTALSVVGCVAKLATSCCGPAQAGLAGVVGGAAKAGMVIHALTANKVQDFTDRTRADIEGIYNREE